MVNAVEDYGYDYAFLLSSGVLLAGGIVIFFGLVPNPTDIGLPEPEDLEEDGERSEGPGQSRSEVNLFAITSRTCKTKISCSAIKKKNVNFLKRRKT